MNERAFTDPADVEIARWLKRCGSTGVKKYVLDSGPNAGAVAWYREMSVSERLLLARIETITGEAPEAFDVERMIVGNCLLHPDLDDYPMPPLAAVELFGRIRQQSHGPLEEDEPLLGPPNDDEEDNGLPEHMVRDIRIAREEAQKLLTDGRYGTLYFNMALRLASRGGAPDPQLFDWLLGLTPGRLRDVASVVELAHGTLLQGALENLSKAEGAEPEKKRAEERRLRSVFFSPFDVIDESTGGSSMPYADEPPEEGPAAAEEDVPDYVRDEELLPDEPITSGAELRRVFEGDI